MTTTRVWPWLLLAMVAPACNVTVAPAPGGPAAPAATAKPKSTPSAKPARPTVRAVPGSEKLAKAGNDGRSPVGVAVAADGTLYISSQYYNGLDQVTAAGAFSTVPGYNIGLMTQDGLGSDGKPVPQESWRLDDPRGLDVGPDGRIGAACYGGSVEAVTAAGKHQMLAGGEDTFSLPTDMAFGPDGTAYVADHYNQRIRAVAPDGTVTTLAGVPNSPDQGEQAPAKDGVGEAAVFEDPSGIAVAPTGDLYVTEMYQRTIRRVTMKGEVKTVATLEDLRPTDVTVLPNGELFVIGHLMTTDRKPDVNPIPAGYALRSGPWPDYATAVWRLKTPAAKPEPIWQGKPHMSNDLQFLGIDSDARGHVFWVDPQESLIREWSP